MYNVCIFYLDEAKGILLDLHLQTTGSEDDNKHPPQISHLGSLVHAMICKGRALTSW